MTTRFRTDPVLFGLLAVSLAVNVYLSVRLHARGTAGNFQSREVVAVGTRVPNLRLTGLAGEEEEIRFDSQRRTVLYVFTPRCEWCRANSASLRALVAQRSPEDRFLGLSMQTEGLSAFIAETKMSFPVFSRPSRELVEALKLGPTPLTIVISPDGTVERAWIGAYAGKTQKEVNRFFSVRLPEAAS